ncbi:hypothetical protein GFO_3063 [Christiangramia forsetii KT0803]|uniref:Uncharacterized protein n=1 Tax=Christiangramia forsetii (strain DSM 17595 / CGMCC 1.15422 / KT0803) TaxID=411154 RepID=A0M5W2_CHRFK|nr:hypothetical protein [Christiangramia forsetii]CAL68007.1 hypothetical protein GFO_3063 [Christiangramia forsetii KT0803]
MGIFFLEIFPCGLNDKNFQPLTSFDCAQDDKPEDRQAELVSASVETLKRVQSDELISQ